MKTVTINDRTYGFNTLADTQEDNHHGIAERFELLNVNNYDHRIGSLIKYTDGSYGVFTGTNELEKELLAANKITFGTFQTLRNSTAGPWVVSSVLSGKHSIAVLNTGADQYVVANVVRGDNEDRSQANAKLISAAPKMYNTIQSCLQYLQRKAIESEYTDKEIIDLVNQISDTKDLLK